MSKTPGYPYGVLTHYQGHVRTALAAIARHRGLSMNALIREYVNAGIAKDAYEYGITINEQEGGK